MPAGSSTDKKQVWLVEDSPPLAGDCDQTLPMHMDGDEIPSSVGVLLERESEEHDMKTGGSKDLSPTEHEPEVGQAGLHVTYMGCAWAGFCSRIRVKSVFKSLCHYMIMLRFDIFLTQ